MNLVHLIISDPKTKLKLTVSERKLFFMVYRTMICFEKKVHLF